MSRIPNLFELGANGLATRDVNPECQWTQEKGYATRLHNGIGYFIDSERRAYRMCRNGWNPVQPDDKPFLEAYASVNREVFCPWTYELVGPDVGDNQEQYPTNCLIPHGRLICSVKINYESIRQYLAGRNMAGLVIWEDLWDFTCRKAKVRQEHFGFRRNLDRRAA